MRRRFEAAPLAHLATVTPAGDPHLVPVTFAVVGDTVYSAVDHKPKTTTRLQRLANIEFLPRASLLVDHYDDDWSRLWWVRADGAAAEVTDEDERDHARDLLVSKYEQYADNRPTGPVVRVTVERWSGWSASSARKDGA